MKACPSSLPVGFDNLSRLRAQFAIAEGDAWRNGLIVGLVIAAFVSSLIWISIGLWLFGGKP